MFALQYVEIVKLDLNVEGTLIAVVADGRALGAGRSRPERLAGEDRSMWVQ